MPKHIMVDLETWSTATNATIISIGAVAFDPYARGIVDGFHVAIDPALLPAPSRHLFDIDPSTVAWWMDPDRDEARAAWLAMAKLDLATALYGFTDWLAGHLEGEESLPIWGNGVAFDNVILRRSYELLNLQAPWGFWSDRCYRTLKALSSIKAPPFDAALFGGVAHSALADATRQALHLQEMWGHGGLIIP